MKKISKDIYDEPAFPEQWFEGTASVYCVTPTQCRVAPCDYKIDSLEDSNRDELRAVHLKGGVYQHHQPKHTKPDYRLNREMMIVVGPGLSFEDVVAGLDRLKEEIAKNGVLIGYGDEDCNSILYEKSGAVVSRKNWFNEPS